ncbi:MAG: porin [Methylophilaceae bacterium]
MGDKLNYAFGINNGVVDGGNISTGSEFESNKEFTARLFATPFKDADNALAGLGFGLASTTTSIDGERNLNFTDTSAADATRNGLPAYLTDGQQTFFRYNGATVADGKRSRIAPQLNYYYGPFGLISEYARVKQDVSLSTGGSASGGGAGTNTVITPGTNKSLNHAAWQVAISYLLTGEDASFKGVKPKQNFDLSKGGWGAWELVARYSEINLDEDTFVNKAGTSFSTDAYADLSASAKSAKSWTTGVNWYLNQNAKIALNYSHTSFEDGAGIGITPINATGTNVRDRESEKALLARLQVAF